MNSRKHLILGCALILSALLISGCAPATDTGVGLPNPAAVHCEDQGYTYEIRTAEDGSQYGVCIFPDGSECDGWAYFRGECGPGAEPTQAAVQAPDPARAREAALAYVREHYGEQTPALTWTEEDTTPEGLVGSSTFQYTAGDWVVTVSYPIVAPEATIYQIVMANPATGFRWEGQVDAAGQVTETLAPVKGDFQPLSPAACTDLADAMAQTLGVEVTTAEAPFEDYVTGQTGAGCQTTATGTGLDFENYWSVAEDLKAMLIARGWKEDVQYQADGPTGTASGLRKEDGLCLLRAGWEPSEDADCPDDQPLATCDLAPEQQLYTIVLNCAEVVAGDGYAGWKTYPSEKFGYTLKYPGDAGVMGTDPDQSVQFVGPVVEDEHWPWFSVDHPDSDFYRPPAGTDVREWVTAKIPYDELGPEVEIAGLPAVHLITHASPQAYGSDDYYFIRGEQLFHIGILHAGGKQDWALYDKFLRSFAFSG